MLLNNKAAEVYRYIYEHPQVLDNMVKHLYQKSVSEILTKLLNISESMTEDESGSSSFTGDIVDNIR